MAAQISPITLIDIANAKFLATYQIYLKLLSDCYKNDDYNPLCEVLNEKINSSTKIDYDSCYLEFNKKYFLKNYFKCLIVAQTIKDSGYNLSNINILDIGCGCGTFSIALSVVFDNQSLKYKLCDSSPKQIELVKRLFLNKNVDYYIEDVDYFVKNHDGLFISSFLLCELYNENKNHLSLNKYFYDNSVKFVFIDYKDILQKFLENEKDVIISHTRIDVNKDVAKLINDDSISLSYAYRI